MIKHCKRNNEINPILTCQSNLSFIDWKQSAPTIVILDKLSSWTWLLAVIFDEGNSGILFINRRKLRFYFFKIKCYFSIIICKVTIMLHEILKNVYFDNLYNVCIKSIWGIVLSKSEWYIAIWYQKHNYYPFNLFIVFYSVP